MRIVFIAAECEPFAKSGGLGDVVDALARALGRLVDLARRARRGAVAAPSTCSCRCTGPSNCRPATTTVSRCESRIRRRRRRGRRRHRRGRRRRLSAAPGGPPAGVRPRGLLRRRARRLPRQRLALRDVLPGGPRGAAGRRTAGRHRSPPRLARGAHGHPSGPVLRRRPDHRAGGDGDDDAQPRLPRLGVRATGSASSGWRPATASSSGGPTASTCCATASSAAELANTVSPGYAAEALTPEYGMGLQEVLARKALLRAPRRPARGSPGSSTASTTDLWNPATDPDLAAAYGPGRMEGKAACRADLLTRLGLDPADPGPVLGMIGRLDPQKGFDILAPPRRRLHRARRPDRRPGQRRRPPGRATPPARRRTPTPSRSSSASTGPVRGGSTPGPTCT